MSNENLKPAAKSSPWWSEFHKTSRNYGNNKSRFEAFCRGCVHARVEEVHAQEVKEFEMGRRTKVHTHKEIADDGKHTLDSMNELNTNS